MPKNKNTRKIKLYKP